MRVFLFSLRFAAASLSASLAVGTGCDSRPVSPIEEEQDARADVVPAMPEAAAPVDGGSGDGAAGPDASDASDADAPDADAG